MKKRSAAALAVPLTLLAAGIGVLLRGYQLKNAMDAQGLLLLGNRTPLILAIFLVLTAALLGVLTAKLPKRERFEDNFSNALGPVIASCLFSVLLLVGNGMLLPQTKGAVRLVPILGILAALTQLYLQVLWQKGKAPSPVLPAVTCIYLIAKLIFDFKNWSSDPVILDYCFKLLAEICSMLASYHVIGFCFAKGRRRIAVFWCCMSTVLCAMSVADSFCGSIRLAEALIYGGIGLWLFMCCLQLLATISNDGKYLKKRT